MASAKEKQFVMKHVFTDIMQRPDNEDKKYMSPKKRHFNVQWSLGMCKIEEIQLYLQCNCIRTDEDWLIETEIEAKILGNGVEKSEVFDWFYDVENNTQEEGHFWLNPGDIQKFLISGSLTVEFHVKIKNMTGIKEKLKSFDEPTQESDVVLKVEEKKFYVTKMILAVHSSYFKSLFFGTFTESKQSEITLKDVDPYDFQNFLEVLYLQPSIEQETVQGILNLADMYDAQSVIRLCEKYTEENSKELLEKKLKAIKKIG